MALSGRQHPLPHDGGAEPGPDRPPLGHVQQKELLEAQRLRKDTIKRQIRRAQSRISAAERKRRTRHLILTGSYLKHVTGDDPDQRNRLMKGA